MRFRLLLCVAAVVVVASCDASVSTKVTADAADGAHSSVEVRLTGAAADAFQSDAELLARLEKVVDDASSSPVERTVSDDSVVISTAASPEEVAKAAELTGVSSIEVAPTDDGAAHVSVGVVTPTRLRDALAATPDDVAVPLLLSHTIVSVTVEGSKLRSVSGMATDDATGVVVDSDEVSATLSRPVDSSASGTFVVVVDPARPQLLVWVVLIAAGFVVAGVLLWKRRSLSSTSRARHLHS